MEYIANTITYGAACAEADVLTSFVSELCIETCIEMLYCASKSIQCQYMSQYSHREIGPQFIGKTDRSPSSMAILRDRGVHTACVPAPAADTTQSASAALAQTKGLSGLPWARPRWGRPPRRQAPLLGHMWPGRTANFGDGLTPRCDFSDDLTPPWRRVERPLMKTARFSHAGDLARPDLRITR